MRPSRHHGGKEQTTRMFTSVFEGMGGFSIDIAGLTGPGSIRFRMEQAKVMAMQVAMGTFIGRPPASRTGPTRIDTRVDLPVGESWVFGSLVQPAMHSLPTMAPKSAYPPTFRIPPPVNRGTTAPVQKETPVQVAPPLPKPPVRSSPSTTVGGLLNINKSIRGNVMDLGSIISTLGTAYIQSRGPQLLPASYGGAYQQTGMSITPAMGIPFYDLVPDAPGGGGTCGTKQLWDPNANCGQGKWVRKSRRRRKRLATASDLKDLASLKGVLGGGKSFETWIATHA